MKQKLWKPRLYQIAAFVFMLRNKFSGLLLDPGLGKTSISLFVIKCLKKLNKIRGVLVIVPLRPLYNTWLKENKKWVQMGGLKVVVLHGDNKDDALRSKADVYLINPEGLKWLKTELLRFKTWPFDMLIVDESTKFKNPSSKRLKSYLVPMLHKFSRRHIMTGTPIPGSVRDMFSQTYILDRGASLGSSISAFERKYFSRSGYKFYDLTLNDGADEVIQHKVQHLMLVMKAEDYISLPKLLFNDIYVDLPKEARAVYDELETELFSDFDGHELRAANCAAKFNKCHQIANGAIYHEQDMLSSPVPADKRKYHAIHEAKLNALADLHEELQFKPLLVAYKYRHDIKTIRKRSCGLPHIGSGVSMRECSEIEEKWNAGKIPMLLGQPQSMAHGLNLQGAGNDVCYYSLDSNLDDYEQFYKRVYRSGVKGRRVMVHRIIARDTVDELIVNRLQKKGKSQVSFKDALIRYRDKRMAQSTLRKKT